jgi:hypothetical protein
LIRILLNLTYKKISIRILLKFLWRTALDKIILALAQFLGKIKRRFPTVDFYLHKIILFNNKISHRVYQLLLDILIFFMLSYPWIYFLLMFTYRKYNEIFQGNILFKDLLLLIYVGFYLHNVYYYCWVMVMIISKCCKDYLIANMDYEFFRDKR